MATLEAIKNASSTSTSVFEAGRLRVDDFTKETSDASSPPKKLLIVAPTVKGEYPVLVFLHGTFLSNGFYTQLFRHIATHGFIVVAPQLYPLPLSGCDELISMAERLLKDPQSVLPQIFNDFLKKLNSLMPPSGDDELNSMAERLPKDPLSVLRQTFDGFLEKLYSLIPPSGDDEIKSVELVVDWLPKGLQSLLPPNVEANLRKVALAGHSRGGKTAFSLALRKDPTSQFFSLLIGLDPVAGERKGHQVPPNVLKYEPRSMNLGIPVMVIGTGLGNESPFFLFPCSCAPDGVNHRDFFDECQPPCCHFVTKDYGHMDMLDDHIPPLPIDTILGLICKKGNGPRDPMRRCVGGLLVAFMRDYLEGEKGDLQSIIHEPGLAPVKLHPVRFIKS